MENPTLLELVLPFTAQPQLLQLAEATAQSAAAFPLVLPFCDSATLRRILESNFVTNRGFQQIVTTVLPITCSFRDYSVTLSIRPAQHRALVPATERTWLLETASSSFAENFSTIDGAGRRGILGYLQEYGSMSTFQGYEAAFSEEGMTEPVVRRDLNLQLSYPSFENMHEALRILERKLDVVMHRWGELENDQGISSQSTRFDASLIYQMFCKLMPPPNNIATSDFLIGDYDIFIGGPESYELGLGDEIPLLFESRGRIIFRKDPDTEVVLDWNFNGRQTSTFFIEYYL